MTSSVQLDGVWTVVVAAGSGKRFGESKQFLDLGGESVVGRSVRIAALHSTGVVVVVPADFVAGFDLPAVRDGVTVSVVAGGASRSDSVRKGLGAVPPGADIVVVHDGARPLADAGIYGRVLRAITDGADAAVPAVPVTDTIRHKRTGTVDRGELGAVQTPQAFRAAALRSAHSSNQEATDDATLVESDGGVVVMVDGDVTNVKITTPSDLEIARMLLSQRTLHGQQEDPK